MWRSWHRIRSESKSLKNRLKSKSNDYSQLEDIFYQITGNYLLSKTKINQNLFNPVSIVISAYNSENTVIKTLYSIESQNLTTKNKQKIQVILVDDGSKNKLVNFIKNYEKEFTFILHIIRSENNQGLSGARNLGFSQALHKTM